MDVVGTLRMCGGNPCEGRPREDHRLARRRVVAYEHYYRIVERERVGRITWVDRQRVPYVDDVFIILGDELSICYNEGCIAETELRILRLTRSARYSN